MSKRSLSKFKDGDKVKVTFTGTVSVNRHEDRNAIKVDGLGTDYWLSGHSTLLDAAKVKAVKTLKVKNYKPGQVYRQPDGTMEILTPTTYKFLTLDGSVVRDPLTFDIGDSGSRASEWTRVKKVKAPVYGGLFRSGTGWLFRQVGEDKYMPLEHADGSVTYAVKHNEEPWSSSKITPPLTPA